MSLDIVCCIIAFKTLKTCKQMKSKRPSKQKNKIKKKHKTKPKTTDQYFAKEHKMQTFEV